jgi:S1-C subfamily serine protease
MASFGAGVLVAAEPAGYLIATARHVIDGDKWKTAKASEKHAMVRTTEGDIATADVVARHNDLDIALLWVKRSTNKVEFRQPIKRIGDIAVGEPVFAFGHPEGLLFSFTTGLVSSKRDGQQIQISAPTSPGSSGGSLYDSRGRLLGVVSSVFDKNREPNAENLNFAVSVEDLLNLQQWQYVRKTDRSLLEYFSLGGNVSTKKANEDQAPPRHKPN